MYIHGSYLKHKSKAVLNANHTSVFVDFHFVCKHMDASVDETN